jgi:hypothetical protein
MLFSPHIVLIPELLQVRVFIGQRPDLYFVCESPKEDGVVGDYNALVKR